MDNKIKELKVLYRIYKSASRATDKADALMIEHPENDEYERDFDKAYQVEFNSMMELAQKLSELINCDIKVARQMIHTVKFDELLKRVQ